MKCRECEKLIYLYNELNHAERDEVHEHLSTCSSCASLLTELQRNDALLSESLKTFPEKLVHENPILTSKIIGAIEKKHIRNGSIVEKFIPIVRFSLIRYAMAAISIVLLLAFIAEVKPIDATQKMLTYYKKTSVTKSVRLNSSAFREQLRSSLQKPKSAIASSATLSKCISECEGSDSQQCKECSNLFNKIKNEGI